MSFFPNRNLFANEATFLINWTVNVVCQLWKFFSQSSTEVSFKEFNKDEEKNLESNTFRYLQDYPFEAISCCAQCSK